MNIGWNIFSMLLAGIPAYLLVALIAQIYNPGKNYFKKFGIYQLFVEPITQGETNKFLTGKIPELISLPLYPIFFIFLLGLFGYGVSDLILDLPLPIHYVCEHYPICSNPSDNSMIKEVYSSHKSLVTKSFDKNKNIYKEIEQVYNNVSKGEENNVSSIKSYKDIYKYQKQWLRLKDKYFISSCGTKRIQVRTTRQVFVYSFILFCAIIIRLIILFSTKRRGSNPNTNQKPTLLLYLLILSFVFLLSSYFLWERLNEQYYKKVIITYYIESISSQKSQ